jgi:hypothetical protein
MTPLKAVTLTTPDGVSRELRDTPGARKRIFDRFQEKNFLTLARDRGDWVLIEVAYLMMYDRDGNPPKDLTLGHFMEDASAAADSSELFAAVMSAVSNGTKTKNEIEVLLKKAQEAMEAETSIGSPSGLLTSSASDSPTPSSGGDTPGPNSPPDVSDMTSENV